MNSLGINTQTTSWCYDTLALATRKWAYCLMAESATECLRGSKVVSRCSMTHIFQFAL